MLEFLQFPGTKAMVDGVDNIDGIAVRAERIEYDASELVACGRFGRTNAPNRAECMYCGEAIAVASAVDLKLREVEPWEKAFNVVLVGSEFPEHLERSPIDKDLLRRATALGPPIPVARIAAAEAAALVCERLLEIGVQGEVVSDEELSSDRAPTRLRSVEVKAGRISLTTFNTRESVELSANDLELVVVGRLFEERSEQTLKRQRKGPKELDARSISKDSGVIDIYPKEYPEGFRIVETGFDFSCLGAGKSIIAAENMKKLVELFSKSFPLARFSSDYTAKRSFLEEVWPSSVSNDSKGIQRVRLGIAIAKAEVTTNTEQFTKYSRLVRRTI